MDRRRNLLKIAALRSERERQTGVYCTNGYLQSQDAGLLFEGPRTLECFFKYIPSDKIQVIAGFGISMIEIYALTTNQLRVYCGGGNATVDIVPGDSYLVDVAYDGTTAICYLNGAEAARFPVTGYKVTDLFRTGSNTYIPQGLLVFCRHYNYALSAEEVAAHYNDGDPAGYVLPAEKKYVVPFSISGQNSYTWTGEADSIYSRSVLLERMCKPGTTIFVKGTVSDYQSGAPFIYAGRGRVDIPAKDGDFTVMVTGFDAFDRVSYYGGLNGTDRRLTITINSVEPVGCVAEYLPQNLVGQWHEKPFEITGITTYTWTGETDPVYYRELLLGRFIQTGAVVMIKGSVSDYQSGEPFVYVGNRQAMIPAQNGSFTLKVINNRDNIDRIYYYGGTVRSDRRLTITINSVELIPDVALSWLDSAKQLPLNDEYLPPLLEPIVISDETPIRITGENSYTWTGVSDPNYSYIVRVSRPFTIGQLYKIRFVVSNWEAGNSPFIKIGTTGSYYLPDFNGNGTYEIYATPNGTPYSGVYVYAGLLNTDRRMTITVDSIEPIVEHSYDLTANGMPQIIIK